MSAENDRLLLLRVAGQRYAIDLAEVVEVTELPEIWPIPLAPDYFAGALNAHGSPVPLLDLNRWLGGRGDRSDGKVLLLDRRVADLALWVDEVERVIFAADTELAGTGEGVTVALLHIGDDNVPLISAPELVALVEADLQGVAPIITAAQQGTV